MELYLVMGISLLGLLFAVALARDVLRRDTGTPAMREISDAIRTGAEAFLRRMNRTIAFMAIALGLLIYLLYFFVRAPNAHDPASVGDLALWTTLSFLLGAACSVASGYMGMWVAIRANIRTAAAAREGMNGALQSSLRGGAVSGFFVVALSLLGVAGLFALVRAVGVTDDVAVGAGDGAADHRGPGLELRDLAARGADGARLERGALDERGPAAGGDHHAAGLVHLTLELDAGDAPLLVHDAAHVGAG